MILDPRDTYLHLAEDGTARQMAGDAFWQMPESETGRYDRGWLVTAFDFDDDWPNWEMHPHGDEFVYLLSGDVELHLDREEGLVTVALSGSCAVVVPRGVWHTATVRAPSRMMFVTRGAGTQSRPVSAR